MYTGTISWNWYDDYDDKGTLHRFKIPHSYYVPDVEGHKLRLEDRTIVIIMVKSRTPTNVFSSGKDPNSRYQWTRSITLQRLELQQDIGSLTCIARSFRLNMIHH